MKQSELMILTNLNNKEILKNKPLGTIIKISFILKKIGLYVGKPISPFNKNRKVTILSTVLLFYFTLSFSQISIKTKIDSNDILIGDQINYNIDIKYSKDLDILWPIIKDSIGSFEVINRITLDSTYSKKDQKFHKSQNITLTTFDTGLQIIPSLKIGYKSEKDSNFKFISTDTFVVNIHSIAVDTSQAIKPIKGILKIPLTFRDFLPYTIIFLILLAIVIGLILYFRWKNNKPLPLFKPKPPLPPHVLALKKLRELEDKKLWQKGEVKAYHIELTEIVKEYIELIFDVPAMESITKEILVYLSDIVEDENLTQEIKSFLELSDLVKFAKLNPIPDENEKCLRTAYQFINSTKPTLFEEQSQEPTN